jgi:hypothetical protein
VNTKREVIVDVVVEVHQEVVEDTLVLILMSTFSSFARV